MYRFLYGEQARFFSDEIHPELKHSKVGTVAMASGGENLNASQFYITLREDLDYLDGKHTVFGEISEGVDTLMRINEAFVDEQGRPYKNIRIKHTYVVDDPFDDPPQLTDLIPVNSPEQRPPEEGEEVRLEDDWIPMDEQQDPEELEKSLRRKEAHSRAVVLEMVGDIPEAEIKPPENVLFVCKLNPVTQEEDLEVIFSRFGKVISADIIRDYKTGDSLCYAFIEFETQEACEAAYLKMDNVLIDDRRIHVDFSQSVSKLWNQYRRAGKKNPGDEELIHCKGRMAEDSGHSQIGIISQEGRNGSMKIISCQSTGIHLKGPLYLSSQATGHFRIHYRCFTKEKEFLSMSNTLQISSESEELSRSAPVLKKSGQVRRKRIIQTKIDKAMAKGDEKKSTMESCIASKLADIGDTDLGPEPLADLIDRSRAGKTSLMRAVKSSGIIRAATFPCTAQLLEFVMECARSHHPSSRSVHDALGKTIIRLDAKFINYCLKILVRKVVTSISLQDADSRKIISQQYAHVPSLEDFWMKCGSEYEVRKRDFSKLLAKQVFDFGLAPIPADLKDDGNVVL
ncbi:hypothetical protein KI387_032212 [Taxus chinensis]|uniref:Peptidyl-prolyl cis-trans isomerase n=1 Tax=Taxus chinensis TaxID=29808 RepID=A0AA38BNL4_TAXCH|nr:hypothetical protein KI387_032212 [Taxus chinensis]